MSFTAWIFLIDAILLVCFLVLRFVVKRREANGKANRGSSHGDSNTGRPA